MIGIQRRGTLGLCIGFVTSVGVVQTLAAWCRKKERAAVGDPPDHRPRTNGYERVPTMVSDEGVSPVGVPTSAPKSNVTSGSVMVSVLPTIE